ncbi:MAG TPA: cation:proton antiporter [Mariprofundaceae bacterium]|nr:cation:proton antiporter [Mariprofundaceae bacterium]
MTEDPVVFTIFLIFTGAAILATVALYARQALLISYILLGICLGPWGAGLVPDPDIVKAIAHIGIIFLLFLIGLNLPAQKFFHLLRKTTIVTGLSSLLFMAVGVALGRLFGFDVIESLVVGFTMMFSSTIIALKLLPTTVLHHMHTGEVMISILLLQDVIAIAVLLFLEGMGRGEMPLLEMGSLVLTLPLLFLFAWLMERYVLSELIRRFDKIQEYIFLLAIGWCLGMAELAALFGLSHEIGAFIAGVSLATGLVSQFIAERLKPLRDFFLVLFFFSIGANLNLVVLQDVILPALVVAVSMLAMKPLVFHWLLKGSGESERRSLEVGFRLGQMSEFSLLIAVMALEIGVIRAEASYLIQASTVLTFLVSSYWIVLRYPTPVAVSDQLRKD